MTHAFSQNNNLINDSIDFLIVFIKHSTINDESRSILLIVETPFINRYVKIPAVSLLINESNAGHALKLK